MKDTLEKAIDNYHEKENEKVTLTLSKDQVLQLGDILKSSVHRIPPYGDDFSITYRNFLQALRGDIKHQARRYWLDIDEPDRYQCLKPNCPHVPSSPCKENN